jgi:predicted transcriptional regulator
VFNSTSELAEDKLLLLYLLEKIKLPISNNQITQIILENNLMNYFTLQQYITELTSTNFIELINQEGKHRITISSEGSKVLTLFQNRVSKQRLNDIDLYLDKQIDNIKKEVTISADYTIEGNNYIVNLKAVENNCILMDLKINVASNKQAKELCVKWKQNSSELYNQLFKVLIDS